MPAHGARSFAGAHRLESFSKLQSLARAPKVVATLEGVAFACGFSTDGSRAWSVGKDCARVWDLTGPSPVEIASFGGAFAGALSPDGKLLALARPREAGWFFSPQIDLQPIGQPEERSCSVAFSGAEAVAFTPDGARLLASSRSSAAIEVFDATTQLRVLPRDEGHRASVLDLAMARDLPGVLVSLGIDHQVLFWDLDAGRLLERFEPVHGASIAVASDGGTFIVGGGEVLRWDARDGTARVLPRQATPPRELGAHPSSPTGRSSQRDGMTGVPPGVTRPRSATSRGGTYRRAGNCGVRITRLAGE